RSCRSRRSQAARAKAARARWPRGTRAHAFRGLGKERPLHRFLVYAAAAAVASPVGVQVQVHPDDVHPQSLRGTRALARTAAARGLLGLARGSARAMSLRSPLGKVLGTGSAKQGVHHWWAQRLTSVALVPLSVWFVVSLLSLPSHEHATVVAWMGQSGTALLLVLLVLDGAWHSQLGLRVVVEDYVHGAPAGTVTLVRLMFPHVP